jgi:4-hydroxybenzoate polyprenyltransferase
MTKKLTARARKVRITPYIRLLRLNNLTGSWLLLWPSLWSIALASGNTIHTDLYLIFIAGAFIMRSAGCIVNDIIDRKFDAKVNRTKSRPLANGDIHIIEAFLLLFVLLACAFLLLLQLSSLAQYLGFAVTGLIILYPFMKRLTYWPQLFLGLTFSWGIVMGWAAVRGTITLGTVILYIAAVLWILGFDTIYGHQDKNDDKKLGLKSTSLKFASSLKTRKLLFISYGVASFLFWITGIIHGLGLVYFFCLFMALVILAWQIFVTDFDNPEQCMRAFKSNSIVGGLLFIGILGGVWWF